MSSQRTCNQISKGDHLRSKRYFNPLWKMFESYFHLDHDYLKLCRMFKDLQLSKHPASIKTLKFFIETLIEVLHPFDSLPSPSCVTKYGTESEGVYGEQVSCQVFRRTAKIGSRPRSRANTHRFGQSKVKPSSPSYHSSHSSHPSHSSLSSSSSISSYYT